MKVVATKAVRGRARHVGGGVVLAGEVAGCWRDLAQAKATGIQGGAGVHGRRRDMRQSGIGENVAAWNMSSN